MIIITGKFNNINESKILYFTEEDCDGCYYCDLTKEMNGYLLDGYKELFEQGYIFGTYIMKFNKDTYVIRFPGATRGSINIDRNTNIIKSINIYEDSEYAKDKESRSSIQCYSIEVLEVVKKYIGYTIEIIK